MKININCKKISEQEIEDVYSLYCKEENIKFKKEDVLLAQKIYTNMLSRDCFTYGAFYDNKLVGVINVNKILDYYPGYEKLPYVHLETFIVDNDFQCMGIGSFLFKEVVSLIKKEGCSYLIIQSNNPYVQNIAKNSGLTQSLTDMRFDFSI